MRYNMTVEHFDSLLFFSRFYHTYTLEAVKYMGENG